jgi:lysozyme
MVFQMGRAGVSRFKKFLTAAGRHEWDEAAKQMLDSRWHQQTPKRAERLAEIFRSGIDD